VATKVDRNGLESISFNEDGPDDSRQKQLDPREATDAEDDDGGGAVDDAGDDRDDSSGDDDDDVDGGSGKVRKSDRLTDGE
jgi:hypothetical protein